MCIECLDPGDTILSAVVADTMVPNIQIIETKVIGIIKMISDHFNIINNELISNDYQIVLVNKGWYLVSELLAGSRLPTQRNSNMVSHMISDQIEKIIDKDLIELDRFDKQVDNIMYTLILDEPKTFFADGFIVKGE